MRRPRYFASASRKAKQATAPHISAMPVRRARRAWTPWPGLSEAKSGPEPAGFTCAVPASRFTQCGLRAVPSLQRLDLHDRGAVVAADPEDGPRARLVDEHPPDVGRARQQVLDDPIGPGIEPRHPVVEHRARPHLAVLRRHDVVGRAPRRRQLPLADLLRRRIEHADAVAAVLGEPQKVLRVDPAAARPRTGKRRLPDRDLAGPGVALADAGAAELEQIEIVRLVGRHAVAADLLAVAVLRLAEVLPLAGRDVEPQRG